MMNKKKRNRMNYNDYISDLYYQQPPYKIKEITFQLTSGCNLNCSYCYEHHKKNEVMSLDTGKKIIDYIISEYELNNLEHPINKDLKGLIFTFIGGEPFLETELMDKIITYFFEQCALKKCPLAYMSRISISSNGLLYFTQKVQEFIAKYRKFLSLNISIDGIKELHDKCRVSFEGEGSFDIAYKAFCEERKYAPPSTKMTFVPESLPYVYDSIIFMIESGADFIACNCAYEPEYTEKDAAELYNQLTKVADYLIEKKNEIYLTIFDTSIGSPFDLTSPDHDRNFCGGTGNMICYAPNGVAYPCVRYAPISLGEEKARDVEIGDCNGLYNTSKTIAFKKEMDSITRTSQSPQKCLDCQIATGCGWCSAYNYEETGSVNKRVTHICWAHRGQVAAIVYFVNKWYLTYKDGFPKKNYLDEETALKFLTFEQWNELKDLEKQAFEEYKKENQIH